MRMTIIACLLTATAALAPFASGQEPQPTTYVFLCFGQSNMEGFPGIEEQDKTVDERFIALAAVDFPKLGRKRGDWYPAVPPLCRSSTGVCPADYFGRTMVAKLPKHIKIGVVNVSVAGCRIELFDKEKSKSHADKAPGWMGNIVAQYGGSPYTHLVEMGKLAQKDGVIKGILLHQGESNNNDKQWPTKVKAIYDDLVKDLNLEAKSVPLLAGELVHADQNGACAGMNSIIAELPNVLPNAHVISSAGCACRADRIHFAPAGYRELGKRYGEKMLSLLGSKVGEPKGSTDPLTAEAIQERIQRYRTAATTLTVVGADGKPLANAPVVVRQTRHQFLFGSNAYGLNSGDISDGQKAYQERFAALFNSATLPFYWSSYEGKPSQPQAERLKKMAQWCADHHITAKGHPLCWHENTAPWLASKSPEEILRLQLERIRREVGTFAGSIDVWDVVNEAVVMPRYKPETPLVAVAQQTEIVPLLRQTFAAAREANPKAILALNDYDTSEKYAELIRKALDAGVPIDVIGIQSHMHRGYWGARRTWDTCERFAKLGKPLHFSEVTILAGSPKEKIDYSKRAKDWPSTEEDEKRQAQEVAEFYTLLFSHPSVQAITWWDFSDKGAWLGAPAGLLRKDMTPRPAYAALEHVVKQQWWTAEVKATTNAAGQVSFRGYLGDYVVETAAGKARFHLGRAGEASVTARVAKSSQEGGKGAFGPKDPKSPEVSADGAVTFRLPLPNLQKVELDGDFKERFTKGDIPMTKDEKIGAWTATVKIPPGSYQYWFIADGFTMPDPSNTQVGELASAFGIEGHKLVGLQSLGASKTTQHWNLPEDKNKAKQTLAKGEVDILVMSPIQFPDAAPTKE